MTDPLRAILAGALDLDPILPVSERLLSVWFGPKAERDETATQSWWFTSSDVVDATLIALFSQDVGNALSGRLDALLETPPGALSLVLLLDPLPRHLWRGHSRAFAGDGRARETAIEILRRGHDRGLRPVERLFCYLPFVHAEDPLDQERGLALVEGLGHAPWYAYAVRHAEAIDRFGRFPQRNAALGRPSTPEEEAYLRDPANQF
ncbi:DUF924 family protein [Pararhodospirillum oryzae]|uniref:DUF924 domain-containing protein n=1 Tax=Pararhodospirillum oryzae TaxID=478448 RepID=A0A512H3Z9_9PROT|nr:DUF924 family protein [Pararhodospirillum oryzae]GEO80167.1 hypothetical protein ROR02_02980 [Pararhodospirillum oryzae]